MRFLCLLCLLCLVGAADAQQPRKSDFDLIRPQDPFSQQHELRREGQHVLPKTFTPTNPITTEFYDAARRIYWRYNNAESASDYARDVRWGLDPALNIYWRHADGRQQIVPPQYRQPQVFRQQQVQIQPRPMQIQQPQRQQFMQPQPQMFRGGGGSRGC